MKFFKTEWHQVASEFIYDISDAKENFSGLEPQGDAPTQDEFDKFDEFIGAFGYSDRVDDWWTDRKGGYDVTFKYEGEEKDQKRK